MERRSFLQAMAVPAALGAPKLAMGAPPSMKITRVDTTYWKTPSAAPWHPNWMWVRLHTDAGHIGLGETYPRNEAEAATIHSVCSQFLLGRNAQDINLIHAELYRSFAFDITGGAEMRALSAIDLALWDLLGKSLGVPVYRLLGGKYNPRVRVYNTCFPYKYDFNTAPDKIMRELIDMHGVRGIKIWPFDRAAARNRHQFVTESDLEEGLAPVRKLRDTFHDEIEILMEFHSNWNLTSAIRIARALEPYKPMWLEDMLLPENFAQYRVLADSTSLPLTISERLAGQRAFLDPLEARAPRYVMFDVTWCGGLTEAIKIASLADAFQLPFAPHTAGGPLLFYASTHLTTASPNVWIQESVQRFYESDWPKMLENPIVPQNGTVAVPELPGFGMQVKPEVWKHPAAITWAKS